MVALNYETGKPELFLQTLENTVLEIPTQEDYDNVMIVFQAGRWRKNVQGGAILPTKSNEWQDLKFEEATCVELKYRFDFDSAWNYSHGRENHNFIYIPEFYRINNITQDNLNDLRGWFDKHFPDRNSKGKKQ